MASRTWLVRSVLGPFSVTLAVFAAGCGDVQTNPGTSPANPLDSEEAALIAAANKARADAGITTPLRVCASLNTSTSAHADDMRDKAYLSDIGKDGSTPRTRACAVGYAPACNDATLSMAEAVASGFVGGSDTLGQWLKDANTSGLILNPALTVAGVGRALDGDTPVWAFDLTSKDDASCK